MSIFKHKLPLFKTIFKPLAPNLCKFEHIIVFKYRVKLWTSKLIFNGVMTRSMVDALSELCSSFLKGGNSTFSAAIASGLFPQTEYRALE